MRRRVSAVHALGQQHRDLPATHSKNRILATLRNQSAHFNEVLGGYVCIRDVICTLSKLTHFLKIGRKKIEKEERGASSREKAASLSG